MGSFEDQARLVESGMTAGRRQSRDTQESVCVRVGLGVGVGVG